MDFANQAHGNAKRLRYGISITLQTIRQRWDIIRVILVLAALIGMWWETNRWLLAMREKTAEARREEASAEPVAEARPTTVAEPITLEPEAVSTPSGPGTGRPPVPVRGIRFHRLIVRKGYRKKMMMNHRADGVNQRN